MGRSILIDTNVIIDLFYRRMPQSGGIYVADIINSGNYCLSVINQIELLGYPSDTLQQQYLSEIINNARILPLTVDVVNKAIELKRSRKIKTPDAIVAATALVFELNLLTRNTKDFDWLQLALINPHEL